MYLPVDCQIKLFDNTMFAILTYGCEIWGFGDISCIEKVHTDSLKQSLHVKKSFPHVTRLGELVRYPLSTCIVIKNELLVFGINL